VWVRHHLADLAANAEPPCGNPFTAAWCPGAEAPAFALSHHLWATIAHVQVRMPVAADPPGQWAPWPCPRSPEAALPESAAPLLELLPVAPPTVFPPPALPLFVDPAPLPRSLPLGSQLPERPEQAAPAAPVADPPGGMGCQSGPLGWAPSPSGRPPVPTGRGRAWQHALLLPRLSSLKTQSPTPPLRPPVRRQIPESTRSMLRGCLEPVPHPEPAGPHTWFVTPPPGASGVPGPDLEALQEIGLLKTVP